ncbi:MAG: hypothetical protein H6728_03075 [Myxococcales bacterium]|nr:hypothetical protein [Myxococcales bacterium]
MEATQDAKRKPAEQTLFLLRWMAWLSLLGLLGLAWGLAATPLKHDDLFWHLQTGEWIVQHTQIPHQDLFSYTRQHTPWVTHEWLFAVLCHGFFRLADLQGLILFKQILAVSILGVMIATARKEVEFLRWGWMWPLLCLVLCAISPFFILRASLLTSLCMALLWLFLQRDSALQKKTTWWAVGLLFLLWGNLHAGVIFGFVLLGCLWAESLWSLIRGKKEGTLSKETVVSKEAVGVKETVVSKEAVSADETKATDRTGVSSASKEAISLPAKGEKSLGAADVSSDPKEDLRLSPTLLRASSLLFLAMFASLLNPNGIEVWLYPWKLNRFFYYSGIKFDLGIFAAPTPTEHPFFFLYLLLCLVCLFPFRQKLRSLHVFEILASGLFLILALRSNRFVFHFMMLSFPWCIRLLLSQRAEPKERDATVGSLRGPERDDELLRWSSLLASCSALAVVALVWLLSRPEFIVRSPLMHFPVETADFLKKNKIRGNMFQHQNEGGFYGWSLRQPIFWDGRNLLFSSLVREYLQVRDFSQLEKRYDIEILLVNFSMFREMKSWLRRHRERWSLVYWDDQSALYLKNLPKFEKLLQKYAYRHLRPFGDLPKLHAWAKRPKLAAKVREELERAVKIQPQAQLPYYLKGLFALYSNDLQLALHALLQAARIRPKRQVYLSLSYTLQRLQRSKEARYWLEKAQRVQ